MMTEQDCALLAKKGISEEQLNAQLSAFQTGFPFLQLEGAADLANGGIYAPDAAAAATCPTGKPTLPMPIIVW